MSDDADNGNGQKRLSREKPLSIAILAMGGQGGGVLADWIVAVAERGGHQAQATSVPGVAQRTGATIYYIELFPQPARRMSNADPVLALMPVPGDVDVVVASELMEAGRAILRGFVTPDRTTLISSTHRVFGITEKSAMGDGAADPERVMTAARKQARALVAFDMDAASEATKSVISAVMFGALAGSGALPFTRADFEAAIKASGVQVDANLAGFAAGFESAQSQAQAAAPDARRPEPQSAAGKRLAARIQSQFPVVVHEILTLGAAKLLDYQDEAYAGLYLDRVQVIAGLETQAGDPRLSYFLTAEAARYLALWMAYEDVIRVSDLKVRTSRFARVRDEVRATPGQIVKVAEFMHPRLAELAEVMPSWLGRLMSGGLRGVLAPLFNKGRQVRVTEVRDFLLLSFLAGLRTGRRGTLRYGREQERIEAWLKVVHETTPADYDLAVELAAAARLIKGYGDTHARGLNNFERVTAQRTRLLGKPQGPAVMANLVRAALADEAGKTLDGVIATLDDPAPLAAE
jgi:indolepyruvate ferredoxin oxidoreductase beta subunit